MFFMSHLLFVSWWKHSVAHFLQQPRICVISHRSIQSEWRFMLSHNLKSSQDFVTSQQNVPFLAVYGMLPQTVFLPGNRWTQKKPFSGPVWVAPSCSADESPHWQRLEKQDEEKPQAVCRLRTDDSEGHHATCHLVDSFVLLMLGAVRTDEECAPVKALQWTSVAGCLDLF